MCRALARPPRSSVAVRRRARLEGPRRPTLREDEGAAGTELLRHDVKEAYAGPLGTRTWRWCRAGPLRCDMEVTGAGPSGARKRRMRRSLLLV
jgi:hypothetical protein